MDTGASKNYIKPFNDLKGITATNEPFVVHSIHGNNKITQKCIVNLFGRNTYFFILDSLSTFDAIIGLDFLRQINAKIDLTKSYIFFSNGSEPLKFFKCMNVNHIHLNDDDLPNHIKNKFSQIIDKNYQVFADPNEALPYNTNVVATIRTRDNDPIYSKSYPYPMGVTDFVNNEIKELLDSNIIKPSRSPYNSPIWVVDKKGVDEQGYKKKRLVIDFKKLNTATVDDKYPIPNISVILSNLGEAKFFTTLDLKAGFHQIILADKDREKTAFSVNNGKYEFCRLPFGLKNAPSIFQRAIDDVLREQIGKSCHVYIDDVIIYSKNEDDHITHIDWVLTRLLEANMRVSVNKSKFFKTNVQYLGFRVSINGIQTSPEKIETMKKYPQPNNLFQLRSFIGLASYYRCFVKDFAKIARPLTDELKGENGKVSASQSKKIPICLNENQISTFNKIKNILISEDVMLMYPDFKKPFDLTTDASSYGLGAVLSQDGKPITFISRTLKDVELNFATNERELLAIVWALRTLRHYLYGVKNLNIFTDHQPLTFAVSDRNPNAKIKRWKAFIDEHNASINYKPGKENIVADALSRQQIKAAETQETDGATIHSEESLICAIPRTENSVNCYRNQIIIQEATTSGSKTLIIFGKKIRHNLYCPDKSNLFDMVRDVVNPNVVNAIHCDLPILAQIQDKLIRQFPNTKFWHTKLFVIDIFDPNEQKEIVLTEHNRAHRAAQENMKQISQDYYFPKMVKITNEIINNCSVCSKSKYKRHPKLHIIGETLIPSYVGDILHIDIYFTDKQIIDTNELILQATIEYNRSIHTTTKMKPIDIIHSSESAIKSEIKSKLITAQKSLLEFHNRGKELKSYEVGDRVYVKNNKRLGNKLSPLYGEGIIEADLGTTVLIKGRVVHKDNIK